MNDHETPFLCDTTEKTHDYWYKALDTMSHIEMARLWRFAAPGHPLFTDILLHAKFKRIWHAYGGMTTRISKILSGV